MRGERDIKARARFLAELRGGATVSAAAKAAGLSRQAPYNWVKRGDAEVAEAMRNRGVKRVADQVQRRPKPPETPPAAPETPPAAPETPPAATERAPITNEVLTNLARATLAGLLGDEDPKIRAKATEIAAKHFQHTEVLDADADDADGADDDEGELPPGEAAARFRVVG